MSLAFSVPHREGTGQTWGQQGQAKAAPCVGQFCQELGEGPARVGPCVSGPRDCWLRERGRVTFLRAWATPHIRSAASPLRQA